MTGKLRSIVVSTFGLALLGLLANGAIGASDPDLTRIKGAIVIVIAKGVVPTQGNAPIASQGTGFFVSKDGYLVTSNHVRSDLGAVDERTVTYEIHFGTTSSDVVAAAPVFVNPAADVMVLYASVADRDVPILVPGNRSEIDAGVTRIYTVGYPQGYQYSIDEGIVKSFGGPIEPVPAWTTSLNFKAGQSGSPILLANMHVIAIVKGNDAEATTIGLVVPSRLVPGNFWDGTTSPTPDVAAALADGNVGNIAHVAVQGTVATTTPARREVDINLKNSPCAGTTTKSYRVSATNGWAIDPTTIDLQPFRTSGAATKYVITDRGPDGFTVAVELSNLGQCINLPILGHTTQIQSGVPAEFDGHATYTETPLAPTKQLITFANAAVLGTGSTPLPNIPVAELQFSLKTSSGEVKPFTPVAAELTTKAGVTYLDTKKAAARVTLQ